jgi:hypothetical protein
MDETTSTSSTPFLGIPSKLMLFGLFVMLLTGFAHSFLGFSFPTIVPAVLVSVLCFFFAWMTVAYSKLVQRCNLPPRFVLVLLSLSLSLRFTHYHSSSPHLVLLSLLLSFSSLPSFPFLLFLLFFLLLLHLFFLFSSQESTVCKSSLWFLRLPFTLWSNLWSLLCFSSPISLCHSCLYLLRFQPLPHARSCTSRTLLLPLLSFLLSPFTSLFSHFVLFLFFFLASNSTEQIQSLRNHYCLLFCCCACSGFCSTRPTSDSYGDSTRQASSSSGWISYCSTKVIRRRRGRRR